MFGILHEMVAGKAALDKRIDERRGSSLPHWTINDLRRSFMANVNLLGFCPATSHGSAILNRIGNHKAAAAGVYN